MSYGSGLAINVDGNVKSWFQKIRSSHLLFFRYAPVPGTTQERGTMPMREKSLHASQFSKALGCLLFVCAGFFNPSSAQASISVTVSTSAPASLQDQFLADATVQYEGILTKSPTANVWTFKISGKKPVINTYSFPDNFLDGFVFGIDDERARNLNTLDGYITKCSTQTACKQDIGRPRDDIYQQNFSTPIAVER